VTASEYLIKSALGLGARDAAAKHLLTQQPVPKQWSMDDQREIDKLLGMLQPSHQQGPRAAGRARVITRGA